MVYWSVDPYMRVEMPKLPVNTTMIGDNIARLESPKKLEKVDSQILRFPE